MGGTSPGLTSSPAARHAEPISAKHCSAKNQRHEAEVPAFADQAALKLSHPLLRGQEATEKETKEEPAIEERGKVAAEPCFVATSGGGG